MISRLKFGILILVCFFSTLAWAQNGKLFNTDNQLSSNLATQVFQDSNGFIWIATRNGLNTYDGYNFTVLKKNSAEIPGLSSNYINCIEQRANGQLLVGTNNSLQKYDGCQFQSIPMLDSRNKELRTYVTQIYPLRNKDVLIGTSGYGIMLLKKDAGECHTLKGKVEKLKYIRRMLEDKWGRLWIVGEDGKLHRREANGKVTSYFPGTEGVAAQDIQQDRMGNIYLATRNAGVYILKSGTRIFSRIPSIGNLPIDDIYISRNGRLFIGSDGLGIYVYDPRTGLTQENPLFSRDSSTSPRARLPASWKTSRAISG